MNLRSFKVAAAAVAMVGIVFTGCKGEDGDDGAAGNANVSSSNYEVLAADWAGAGIVARQNSNITTAVVNSGAVITYASLVAPTDSAVWRALPEEPLGYRYDTDTVRFTTPGFTGLNQSVWYKVIVIPAAAMYDGVDLNDFEETKLVYGLED